MPESAADQTIVKAYDAWREYERRKQAWIFDHPAAKPSEYEAAMRRIADECGA